MNKLPKREESLDILEGKVQVPKELLMDIKMRYSKELTYSKNVFVPLTRVCRNRCGYCTFRREAIPDGNLMSKEDVRELVLRADRMGCHEALLTFGERADDHREVRDELSNMGYDSMVEYIYDISKMINDTSGLMVHTNAGLLNGEELRMLKEVNASMGLMLETSSERLMHTIAHMHSPGKDPKKRADMMEAAGRLRIPFTTGILIGIGETSEEILNSMLEIRRIQDRWGHLQEIIVQNFVPKNGTPMASYKGPGLEKMRQVISLARLMFPDMAIQLPPNLNRENVRELIGYGIDDLGGVSPISIDHVNPESPWPMEIIGDMRLNERLPVYPRFISKEFLSERVYKRAMGITDGSGYVRK